MFDSSFPFKKINKQHFHINGINSIWPNYSFKGKNKKRYIVIAEQFNYEVYAIKFYLQEHKSCKHKFERLSKQNECSRVIFTVGKIIKEIYQKQPYASFTFIGSPLKNEPKGNTKRFKLYSSIIGNFISPVNFEHRYSIKHSAYLLLNKANNEPDLLRKIENMFKPYYDIEFNLI